MVSPSTNSVVRSSWRDWLELIRFPNVFTVVSNSVAGFALAQGTFDAPIALLLCVASSCSLYWAGMILNDVYDVEEDIRENRPRPITQGRIDRRAAARAGRLMLASGVIMATLASLLFASNWGLAAVPIAVVVLLAVAIVAYDSGGKSTSIGALLMGSCRGLNFLFAWLVGWVSGGTEIQIGEIDPQIFVAPLVVATGLTLYISGVTLFAKREATTSNRQELVTSIIITALGLAAIAAFPVVVDDSVQQYIQPAGMFSLLVALIGSSVIRRQVRAVSDPEPIWVQMAVKHAFLSMIFLDAGLVLMVAGGIPGTLVCILILPAMFAGKLFRST